MSATCSGCAWIERPLDEQLHLKRENLRAQWRGQGLDPAELGELPIVSIAPAGLRERVDLIFQRIGGVPRFGLFARESRELLAWEQCPALTEPLQRWFDEVRAMPPPIEKGSLRLRVSPDGQRGIWLDFANIDIKNLLQEGSWLAWLAERAVVEIGQKRKRLVSREGQWKLDEPELHCWLPTFIDDKPRPVYSAVASFTQVGAAANRALVAAVTQALPATVSGRWIELGAGIGNFTLPLAQAGAEVVAVENDELALAGLRRGAEEAGLAGRVTPARISFHARPAALGELVRRASGLLADPPRSGLGAFVALLAELPADERPRNFVYVSCYGESFAADAAALRAAGYRLRSCLGVDQFPQTPHLETVARFELTV